MLGQRTQENSGGHQEEEARHRCGEESSSLTVHRHTSKTIRRQVSNPVEKSIQWDCTATAHFQPHDYRALLSMIDVIKEERASLK